MNAKIVVGSAIEAVTQKLLDAIGSLPPNKVVKLGLSLSSDVIPVLSTSMQGIDTLFGLRLILKTKQSMAHSGWLYSHYLDACRKSNFEPATTMALYSEGHFREFEQFGVLEQEVFFLGFGTSGDKMLRVVLQAESQFNPNNFDIDGYTK